jgi:RPA family protein
MAEIPPSTAPCQLNDAERVELFILLRGAVHPIVGRALELKTKSGMSWLQLGMKQPKEVRKAEQKARRLARAEALEAEKRRVKSARKAANKAARKAAALALSQN